MPEPTDLPNPASKGGVPSKGSSLPREPTTVKESSKSGGQEPPSSGNQPRSSRDFADQARRGDQESSGSGKSPDKQGPDKNGPDAGNTSKGSPATSDGRAGSPQRAQKGDKPSEGSEAAGFANDEDFDDQESPEGGDAKKPGGKKPNKTADRLKGAATGGAIGAVGGSEVDGVAGAAQKAARVAASEYGSDLADSAQRIRDAKQRGGTADAALEAATEAGAEAASKFGVPKSAVRKGVKVLRWVVVAVVIPLVLIMTVVFFAVAAMDGGQQGSAPPGRLIDFSGSDVLEEQAAAAAAYDLPPGLLGSLSMAATENGKFSPYSDDTIDRAPKREGIRRPSSGAGSTFGSGGGDTGGSPSTSTVAAAATGSVALVGDSLCEDTGDNQKHYLDSLGGVGAQVGTTDCARGRPLAGAGEQAITDAAGSATTMVVSLGTNDLPGNDAAGFAQRVESTLQAHPTVTFLWFNFAASKFPQASKAFNDELARLAGTTPRLVVIDIAGAVTTDPSLQAGDGVHLTGEGQQKRAILAAGAYGTAVGSGVPGGAGSWPANPPDVEVSDYPQVKPAIGGEGKASGPYLIQPRALALYPDVDAQDFGFSGTGEPKTATDLVAKELASIRDDMVDDGRDPGVGDPEAARVFWAEAVKRLPVADPRMAECRVASSGAPGDVTTMQVENAQRISQIWFCEIAKAPAFYTLSGVSKSKDTYTSTLSASEAASTVVTEAMQVAWAFSQWGTSECDPAAELAGVFPLTKEAFDTYADDAGKSEGRCNPAANIRAAARGFIAGEQVVPGGKAGATGSVGDRSEDQGTFAPMLGGWRVMPWALGGDSGLADFVANGPSASWSPDSACSRQLDSWVAATGEDNSFSAGSGNLDAAPVCDAPGGGGVGDPDWVREVRSRLEAALAAVSSTTDAGAHDHEINGADETDAGNGADEADGEAAPEALAETVNTEANLQGALSLLGGPPVQEASLPLGRVTTSGRTPSDMPPVLLVAGEGDPDSGSGTTDTSGYPAIVVGLAEKLGGLVPGWFGDEKKEDGPETEAELATVLSMVQVLAPSAPGLVGTAGGNVGDEIPYAALFNEAGAKHGIDPRFLASVAWAESGYRDDVVNCTTSSSAGAKGLMQFMPATAAGFGIDPCDPAQAVDGSARYYKGLYAEFGSWELALAGYNAGGTRVRRCMCVPNITETKNYVTKIMGHWEELKARYPDQLPVGGQFNLGTAPIGAAPVPGGQMVNTASRGQVCVVKVPAAPGLIVNCTIAGNVDAMIRDAAAAGVTLTGGGHRPVEVQIQLRQKRCPGRVYDRGCRGSPPTAVPGRSMHELGEAIDFRNCGSRSTACYLWLNNNAARYGLKNLPSEAWHWSTNGN